MQRRYYLLWLVAMAFAETGSSFDVGYHFSHIFDEFSIPHMIVAVGVVLMVALLAYALYHERDRVVGLERGALKVAAIALAIGIADEPLDLLWHLTFGVDISLWSPTHLMLNYPADVINVCVLVALLASPAARSAGTWAIGMGYCLRNLITLHFALYQQEYGSVALNSLQRTGKVPWYVEPALMQLVGARAQQLVTGGVPDWLYLVYFPLAMGYGLALAATVFAARDARTRRASDYWPFRFGIATTLAAAFVTWMLLLLAVFLTHSMAYPTIPWYLLPMGLVIDLGLLFGPRLVKSLLDSPMVAQLAPRLANLRPHASLVAAAGTGVLASLTLYGGMTVMRALHGIVPATPLLALPFACVTGAVGVTFGVWLAIGARRRVEQSRQEERLVVVRARPTPRIAVLDRLGL
ncbi:MAG TPA: hypothetical protein VF120_01685 [Ktedonobacterales bacterium]